MPSRVSWKEQALVEQLIGAIIAVHGLINQDAVAELLRHAGYTTITGGAAGFQLRRWRAFGEEQKRLKKEAGGEFLEPEISSTSVGSMSTDKECGEGGKKVEKIKKQIKREREGADGKKGEKKRVKREELEEKRVKKEKVEELEQDEDVSWEGHV